MSHNDHDPKIDADFYESKMSTYYKEVGQGFRVGFRVRWGGRVGEGGVFVASSDGSFQDLSDEPRCFVFLKTKKKFFIEHVVELGGGGGE